MHGEMVMSRVQREGHIPLLPKCRNNQCRCGSLFAAAQLGPAKHPSCSEQTVGWDFLARWSVWFPNAMEGSHSRATVGTFFSGLSSVLSSFKPGRWQSGKRIWKIDGLKLKPGIWNSFGRPRDNTSKLFSPTRYSIIFCLVKVLLGNWSHSWGFCMLGTVTLGRK